MASSQTIAEAVENSLNAFNIIAKKNLEAVSFDNTVKCKIIGIENRDLGEYKVTDGSSIFTAYSEKTDYIKDTLVWVTIPQGDYSKQKLITGKYIESDNSENYTYISPLDSFVDITQNLIEPGSVKTTGLIANGDVEEIYLWHVFGREYKGYDKLAIQAGFKSWLKSLNVKSGTYGLRLDITSKVLGTSQTSNDRKFYSIVLNTNDMYGDVYNFETFYSQVKVIDISMIDCIDSMSLVFYQGKDFKVSETEPLRYPNVIQDDIDLSNIWVDSPYISLGYDINRFTEDTLLLYTLDSATYASYLSEKTKDYLSQALDRNSFSTEEEYLDAIDRIHNDDEVIDETLKRYNKKNLRLRWIHFPSEDAKPVIIDEYNDLSQEEKDNIIIHWYHYRLEEGVTDQIAGNYWEEDLSLRNKFEYLNFYPDIENQTEKFKVIIEYPTQEICAKKVYDDEMFKDKNKNPVVDYFPEGKKSTETFYQWVKRGLDSIEEQKMECVTILANENRLSDIEDEIYEEYLQALEDEAEVLGLVELRPTDAAADKINEIYRKKMMNVKTELEEQKSLYVDIYNKIAKVLGEVKYYYSDVLEFTCEDQLPNNMTLQLIRGLTLEVDPEGFNGNYHVYNEEGQIISKKENQKKRIITAKWTSIVTGDRALDGIERIEWYIPTVNTMIEFPRDGIEYQAYDPFEVTNAVDFNLLKLTKPLYTYNRSSGNYEKTLAATQYESGKTYYVKNNTSYALLSSDHPEYPNYFKIVRSGNSFENHIPGTEEPSASGQVFRIKEFYSPNYINNTIKCIVKKNNSPFAAEATLTFGPTGTNGTDYSFELEIDNKVQALTAGQTPYSEITIIPHLYNFNGEDIIKSYLGKLKYSWWSPSSPTIDISGTRRTKLNGQEYWTGNSLNGSITLSLLNIVTIENAQYHILYAELTDAIDIGSSRITLTTFKPIPVRSSERYVSIDGADRISYDSSGVNPSYYKDPYILYVYKNKSTIPIEQDNNAAEKPVKWEVSLGSDTIGAIAGSTAREFYPILSKENTLIPPSYYLQDNGKQVAVNCLNKNNQIIWTQPLYIYQNSYTSAMLNSWDGKLTIDEENGTILSTVVGAGAKDEKNRFNGTLMGDLTDVDNTPVFGLYGYNEGVKSFGFKIDGTAFIGKTGKGQINFDGNSGRISSLSYNLPSLKNNENEHYRERHQGMVIDLDDGFIEAHGANLKNVKYLSNNQEYTIDQVLTIQKTLLKNQIDAIDEEIVHLNDWADKVLIQKYTNAKNRIQSKYDNVLTITNDFNRLTFSSDYEKLKYLQDKGATYLINDDMFTPIYEESNSQVRLSTTDPYLVVTSENSTDLLRISKNIYFLQTDNFVFAEGEKANYPYNNAEFLKCFKDRDSESGDSYGDGMLFDLSHGYLLGYNFKLKGVNNGQEGDAQSQAMKDSYFELNSSGNPFLIVHLKTSYEPTLIPLKARGLLSQSDRYLEKDLMWISRNKFLLQSFNYFEHKADVLDEFFRTGISQGRTKGIDPNNVGAGVLLDLTGGKLSGHDFEISSVDTGTEPTLRKNQATGKYVADGPAEPEYTGSYIYLGSSGNPYFRIHYQNIPSGADRADYGKGYVWEKVDEKGILINQNIDLINISKSAWEINSRDFQRPSKETYVLTSDTIVQTGKEYYLLTENPQTETVSYTKVPNPVNNQLSRYYEKTTTVGKGIHLSLEGDHQLSLNSNGSANYGSFIEAYSFGLDAYKPGLYKQDLGQKITINSAASGGITENKIQIPVPNLDYLNLHKDVTDVSIQREIDNQLAAGKDANQVKEALGADAFGNYKVSVISNDVYDDPLMLGGLFSVTWQGKVKMNYLIAEQGGKIGPFNLNSKALYSNNGFLSNASEFYDNNTGAEKAEPTNAGDNPSGPPGVYLGRDGFSVRNKFVVYKNPINRVANDGSNLITESEVGNANQNFIQLMKYPRNTSSGKNATVNYGYEHDFVTTGNYSDSGISEYFENMTHSYDQVFRTSNGNVYALKDLSFYLNGNSVLNGTTAINGNTYIFGRMQVGELPDIKVIGNEIENTDNHVVMYANTTIYGVFRTTGKSFIGSKDEKWYTDDVNLRADTKNSRGELNEKDSSLGFIVYRNSYISGYLKVGGSMIVGDANIDDLANTSVEAEQLLEQGIDYSNNELDSTTLRRIKSNITKLHGDFTVYTLNSRFFGDVEIAAGFVAGSLKDAEPASSTFPKVYKISNSDTDSPTLELARGSGIQSSNIFLGRTPSLDNEGKYKKHPKQSHLSIYADTEQWGSFIAGRYGSKTELYACEVSKNGDLSTAAYLKINTSGIEIRTWKNKPLTITTRGGDITIDGRETSGLEANDQTSGGNITIYGGNNKNLSLEAGEDFITFEKGALSISAHKKLSIIVTKELPDETTTEQNFKIDENGITLTSTNNLEITATGKKSSFSIKLGQDTEHPDSEFTINKDGITLQGTKVFNLTMTGKDSSLDIALGTDVSFKMNQDEISIVGNKKFSLTVNNGREGESTLDFAIGSSQFKIDKEGIILTGNKKFTLTVNNTDKDDTSSLSIAIGKHSQFDINKDGITLSGQGDINISGSGGSFLIDSTNNVKISSSSGAYFQATPGGQIILNGTPDQGDVATHKAVALQGSTYVTGDLWVTGTIHANGLGVQQQNKNGVTLGDFPSMSGLSNGFYGGANGNGFGNWHVVGNNFQSGDNTFILDPDEDRIIFNETDIIDGAGKSNTNKGISISSTNAIWISPIVYLGKSWNDSGSSGLIVTSEKIDAYANIYSHSTLYFGAISSDHGHSSQPNYYIETDGNAKFNDITVNDILINFDNDGSNEVASLKESLGALAFEDDIKKKFNVSDSGTETVSISYDVDFVKYDNWEQGLGNMDTTSVTIEPEKVNVPTFKGYNYKYLCFWTYYGSDGMLYIGCKDDFDTEYARDSFSNSKWQSGSATLNYNYSTPKYENVEHSYGGGTKYVVAKVNNSYTGSFNTDINWSYDMTSSEVTFGPGTSDDIDLSDEIESSSMTLSESES